LGKKYSTIIERERKVNNQDQTIPGDEILKKKLNNEPKPKKKGVKTTTRQYKK